jgi:hypothetical protein
MAADLARVPYFIRNGDCPILPARLTQCIALAALQLLFDEYKGARREAQNPCTQWHTTVYSLPCSHYIREQLKSDPNWIINGSHIDPFWYYERPATTGEVVPLILGILPPVEPPQLPIPPPIIVRSGGRG